MVLLVMSLSWFGAKKFWTDALVTSGRGYTKKGGGCHAALRE